MGFDTSFHPVDGDLIQRRILPYVTGQEGNIDDLIERAVRLAKVRFRANAWGLGALALVESEPSLSERLDSMLHVWGRPFFITDETPDAVSASIDRYLAAEPRDVDAIARDMLRRLEPGLEDRVKPDAEGRLPRDKKLAAGLLHRIDLVREIHDAMKAGEPYELDGEEHDPAELLSTDLPHVVIDFAANFTPGWMARGYVWPTYLLSEAKVDEDLFGTALVLFESLLEELPGLEDRLEATITENYVIGGYVPPKKVPALIALLEANREAILAASEDCEVELRKILEAAHDARRRGLGFLEATEIYSGMGGIMN